MIQKDVELLAIISIERDKRVRCQAPDCNQVIYQKVYVIADEGKLKVIGSSCYKQHYRAKNEQSPTGTGKRLSNEERELLLTNTQALIDKLKEEHKAELAAMKAKKQAEAERERAPRARQTMGWEPIEVKCLYCGCTMIPLYSFTPAKGHKCQDCKNHRTSTDKLLRPL